MIKEYAVIRRRTNPESGEIEYVASFVSNGQRAAHKSKIPTLAEAKLVAGRWGVPVRGPYQCIACGGQVADYYMVQNDIWESALFLDGVCHVQCLEEQIERELKLEDFTDAPVNNMVRFGFQRGYEQGRKS